MEECGSNVFDLPPSVNATLFFGLLSQGSVLEAIKLLPPEWISRLSSNSSGLVPVKKNCTISGPKPSTLFSTDVTLITVYAWILLLTSVVGIVGNALVMVVYCSRPKELTAYKWSLVHLAACDLCFSILQVIGAMPSLQQIHWPYGNVGCKLLKGSIQLGGMVAVGTLLVIAMERYIGVLMPLRRGNRGRRTAVALAVVWVISLLSLIPALISYRYDPTEKECSEKWNHSGLKTTHGYLYGYYLLIVFFVFPMACITFSYVKIGRFLWQAREKNELLYGNLSPDVVERRRNEDRRRIRVLLAVVVAFSLCVLPRRIFWVVVQHVDLSSLPLHSYYGLIYAGMLPYPFHVAVNPIIYSLVDVRFRENAKVMMLSVIRSCARYRETPKKQVNIQMAVKTRKETTSMWMEDEKV
uniref:Neuropeptide-like GPCR n=1 Tax=Tripedalia cystophora TaxID=6141 RepID=A0A4D5XWA7_TRICY|nr:neuropeptide-like GPCR [Tripedalia cystophora]